MLATLGSMPKRPGQWAFEYKWDGMRALCYHTLGSARLESRNLRDVTSIYPDLIVDSDLTDGSHIIDCEAIFDGEIVAFDQRGRPSFKRLQRRMHVSPRKARLLTERVPVYYYVFDLLWLDGRSLLDQPYVERRRQLEALSLSHERWKVPPSHIGEGEAMMRVARKLELEGLIAKRPDSVYRPGIRSKQWVKVKIVHRQKLVVGGWEPRKKNRKEIGALLLGYYTPESLGLQLAGRVGTGFDRQTHRKLVSLLERRASERSPFADKVGSRNVRFVEPTLVAEVDYRRWPEGGHLQQASFQGIRDDVPARDVVLEKGA
jgi:bifunctional non-homologous end joining protein LigD